MEEERRPAVPSAGCAVMAGGRRFHVITLGAPSLHAPLVFLHGGGPGTSAWSDFAGVAPDFAGERLCVLIDLLQYGGSEKCAIEGPVWNAHAQALVLLLDALGIGQADFACNSWGGSAALCLAACYPQRVRRLVITGSMPTIRGEFAALAVNGFSGRVARDAYYGGEEGPTPAKMRRLLEQLEWFDPERLPEETVRLRYEQSIDPGEMALAAHSNALRGAPQDLGNELMRISCPALFLWGRHDPFLPPAYAERLARVVQCGAVEVIDHASHHPAEEQPDAYKAAVRAFLDDSGVKS